MATSCVSIHIRDQAAFPQSSYWGPLWWGFFPPPVGLTFLVSLYDQQAANIMLTKSSNNPEDCVKMISVMTASARVAGWVGRTQPASFRVWASWSGWCWTWFCQECSVTDHLRAPSDGVAELFDIWTHLTFLAWPLSLDRWVMIEILLFWLPKPV